MSNCCYYVCVFIAGILFLWTYSAWRFPMPALKRQCTCKGPVIWKVFWDSSSAEKHRDKSMHVWDKFCIIFFAFFLLFTVLVILKLFSVFVWNLIEVGIETNLDCMVTLMVYYYHHIWWQCATKHGGNRPPHLNGGLFPPILAYLGQWKSTNIGSHATPDYNIGGIFPPPFLQCTIWWDRVIYRLNYIIGSRHNHFTVQ